MSASAGLASAIARAREALEGGFGQRLAEESGRETAQISDRCATAPDPLAGCRAADVDELVGLAAFDNRLRGEHRHHYVEEDISDHRPEQGMCNRIEA